MKKVNPIPRENLTEFIGQMTDVFADYFFGEDTDGNLESDIEEILINWKVVDPYDMIEEEIVK